MFFVDSSITLSLSAGWRESITSGKTHLVPGRASAEITSLHAISRPLPRSGSPAAVCRTGSPVQRSPARPSAYISRLARAVKAPARPAPASWYPHKVRRAPALELRADPIPGSPGPAASAQTDPRHPFPAARAAAAGRPGGPASTGSALRLACAGKQVSFRDQNKVFPAKCGSSDRPRNNRSGICRTAQRF